MSEDIDTPFEDELLPGFEAPEGAETRSLADLRDELNLDFPIVKAEELVDKTFTIHRAKAWESPLGKGGMVYFCTCQDADDGEMFCANLGGQAVVETLSRVFAAGVRVALQVTLRRRTGGKYGRYYVLE